MYIVLYPINIFFYNIDLHDKIFNMNSLDHQNEVQNTWIAPLNFREVVSFVICIPLVAFTVLDSWSVRGSNYSYRKNCILRQGM